MALRDLSAQEMISVSSSWVEPGQDLPTLQADSLLMGPAQLVRKAHRRLMSTNKQAGVVESRIKFLTAELSRLDGLHDRKGRGIYTALEAGADLADDLEEAELYERLKETLFPKGLAITQSTYRAQAGAAEQVRGKLTADDREALAEINFSERTLLDRVEEWLDTAELMGRYVSERAKLADDDDDEAVTQSDVRDARLEWIRATKALLMMLELSEIDEEKRAHLLADLHEAERDAARRARSEKGGEGDDPPEPNADAPAPQPGDAPDVTEPV